MNITDRAKLSFEILDFNHNGAIERGQELSASAFDRLDANHDGKLTAEELAAAMRSTGYGEDEYIQNYEALWNRTSDSRGKIDHAVVRQLAYASMQRDHDCATFNSDQNSDANTLMT